jgi:DNA mismatch endonuclease (patch repair protein)
MALSKRQVGLRFGFNQRLVETLIAEEVFRVLPGCTPLRPKIDPESLEDLVEGEHYVVCRGCGGFQAQITTKHLRACSGVGLAQYISLYPKAPTLSRLARQNKAKSEEQKAAQSAVLKARFQTPAGNGTREQIRAAAHRQMESGYKARAAAHLRALGAYPEIRARRSRVLQGTWLSGKRREIVEGWHRKNRVLSLQMAANARSHIQKTSRLHLGFKDALVAAGVRGFITEYPVGFYSVDEAHPELKVVVEVDGCYWHGCFECGFLGVNGIVSLDKRKNTYLSRQGWVVVRLAEHDIKKNLSGCIERVVSALEQREAA